VGTTSNGTTELNYYADLYGTNSGRSYSAGISGSPDRYFTITDWTPRITLDLGPGCKRGSAGKRQAVCQDSRVSNVNMFYGEGSDYALVAIAGAKATVYGEGGDDYLRGNNESDDLHGGNGNDTLDGGDGFDRLFPEGGNDTLVGGAGVDSAWYTDYATAVTISLDGVANDGAAGERQNVDVEYVFGGPAGDTLTGGNNADLLHGMQGDDVLEGGGGADSLYGHTGDDTIWALDNTADYITCGDGYDQVLADYKDDVWSDCEAVSRI
jgi:Ca2+-binding RTX toxin-like protein